MPLRQKEVMEGRVRFVVGLIAVKKRLAGIVKRLQLDVPVVLVRLALLLVRVAVACLVQLFLAKTTQLDRQQCVPWVSPSVKNNYAKVGRVCGHLVGPLVVVAVWSLLSLFLPPGPKNGQVALKVAEFK